MNLSNRLVSLGAAAALLAGAGAMSAMPASAKIQRTISGGTVIDVPLPLVTQAATAGVIIDTVKPAKAEPTMDTVSIYFPATFPETDGVLPHGGGLSLASSKSGVTLTLSNPWIEYATSGGDTANISGVVGGIPPENPLAKQLNGQRIDFLNVANFKINWKTSKVRKVGKKYQKTITQTMSGDVTMTSNAVIVGGLNTLMGVEIFTAGSPFGQLGTKWSVKITCDTLKECK